MIPRKQGKGDPEKRAIAELPPSFRTASHSMEAGNRRGLFRLVTKWRERFFRPGSVIDAADRKYLVTKTGQVMRARWESGRTVATHPRQKPVKVESKARAKGRERIEAGIEAREEHRESRIRNREARRASRG